MRNNNWAEDLALAMEKYGETWQDVVSHTFTAEQLHERFDHGYGAAKGSPFTVWTKGRVYFPWQYDGSEGVASVSRNPDGKATDHVGGRPK